MNLLTLDSLVPNDFGAYEFGAFVPHATYSAPMDCIVYLNADVAYRADRVDQFLTILWHPQHDMVVGAKLKGCRFIFKAIQDVVKSVTGNEIPSDKFVTLLSAVEFAMTVRVGSVVVESLQTGRADYLDELNRKYELAKSILSGVDFDLRSVGKAA